MRYYDKTTHNMVFVESDSTIPWAELPQDFLDYANNLQDKSYEVNYDEDGMPIVKRLQLDEDGNRYSHYLEDGTPDLVKIAEIQVEQSRAEMNSAIQSLLDMKAQEFRYDNMVSARSYAGYENPFQAEAQSLAVWASSCWVKAGEIEAEVIAGTRAMPTVEEVLAEMPVYS